MAGWGNENFDMGAAGGWGDVSFAGGESQTTDWNTEKIAIPATVKDLSRLAVSDEKLTLGKTSFTTIRVVGKIKRCLELDGGQSIEYLLEDLEDEYADFLIMHYRGVSVGDGITSGAIVEDTLVVVVGKLRSFNERLCIVAFDVREVEDRREVDAFKLEAKLARLYYTKGVMEMAFTGDLTRFEGSMLRGHKDGSANDATAGGESKPGGWVSNTTTATGIRPPQSATHGDDNCRGLTGQKAEIFKYLRKNGDPNIGLNVEAIRAGIPKNVYNARTFAADLEDLSSEGLIYTTCDDDHYVVNA
uniref:RPA_C domain-containing protein n=1 Tax=Ascaris lumbricoides TaxID=6252 RepID=A0A0M3IGQ4_ASCLU